MKIIVNGMGCNQSGAKLVLIKFLESYQFSSDLKVFMPFSKSMVTVSSSVRITKLNHKLFGQVLRPLYDLYITLYACFTNSDFVFNLSNYGLPFFNKEIVYIHSPMLVSETYYEASKGLAAKYKRFAFLYTLKKAHAIIVQTDHMKSTLKSFMNSTGIKTESKILVFKPQHEIPKHEERRPSEKSKLNFFYPTSLFPHKRADLAINGILLSQFNSRLSITIDDNKGFKSKRINFLGKINFDEVVNQFNSCDALLFTSEKETLGLPLLEALSLSKPAVLPNLPYAVEIYGEAGVYFDSFEPEDVAKAIDYLVSNLDVHKLKALERKESEFSIRLTWEEQWQKINEMVIDD